MTPNQYRCETCKKPHKVPDGLSRQPHFFCCDEELPYDTAVVTTIRGCASHSDFQSERDKVLDDVDKILNCRTELMEELFDELRDPAVAKHSLQQIEIIRSRVNDLRDMKAGEP